MHVLRPRRPASELRALLTDEPAVTWRSLFGHRRHALVLITAPKREPEVWTTVRPATAGPEPATAGPATVECYDCGDPCSVTDGDFVRCYPCRWAHDERRGMASRHDIQLADMDPGDLLTLNDPDDREVYVVVPDDYPGAVRGEGSVWLLDCAGDVEELTGAYFATPVDPGTLVPPVLNRLREAIATDPAHVAMRDRTQETDPTVRFLADPHTFADRACPDADVSAAVLYAATRALLAELSAAG